MKTSTFTTLSRFTVALLVLAVTWADTDTAEAQRGRSRSSRSSRGRDGLMDLAQDREVRAELKLTDEQIESVGEIRDKSRSGLSEKFREFGERIAAAKDDAERTKIEAERTDYFAAQRKAASPRSFRPNSSAACNSTNSSVAACRGSGPSGSPWN